MVFDYEWFSPTRTVGLMSYAASFLASAWRLRSCLRERDSTRPFGLLTGAQLCLLLDMAFDWRWKLHEAEEQVAGRLGVYGLRRIPQLLALVGLSIALLLATILISSIWRRRVGAVLSLAGTLLAVGLWCCEVISFHFMDQFLYQMLGRVMVVSVAWASLAAVTCLGIWLDSRRHQLG